MRIYFTLNNQPIDTETAPNESLLELLRRLGCLSVKRGCQTGECGACSVLIDGRLLPTCVSIGPQVDGRRVQTVEGLSEGNQLHPIQAAFVEAGAIQCGYCTPGMILATKALLDQKKHPTIEEAREMLASILCRCTGYVRPVDAVMRAAALLRGDPYQEITQNPKLIESIYSLKGESKLDSVEQNTVNGSVEAKILPSIKVASDLGVTHAGVVGMPEEKKDAVKLVKGRPVFTDDFSLPGMLYAAMLTSPHSHARIREIDTSKAKPLPGVHAVLSYKDISRVVYSSGGQSYPNPKPWDQVCLDHKVRFMGDRVAIVAADSLGIANEALKLIKVDYQILPAVFDPEAALAVGAPIIHDEPDAVGIRDHISNLAVTLGGEIGNVDQALKQSDHTYTYTYSVQQVQQASVEPHVCITYWDEDDRLVIRTSTQVPFHVRRMISPLIGIPVNRIRVIKPRVGGGFGGKQEMLIEDLAAHLTVLTGRPVRFEYTREQEFTSARSRHPAKITYRAGVRSDGHLEALEMNVILDTGAYGVHGMTVGSVMGMRGLSTYRCENARFTGRVVYTNKPTCGAFRGYGAPQALFALESLMDEIAVDLGMDPIELRMKNAVRLGDPIPIMNALGEAGPVSQSVTSCSLPECVDKAAEAIHWNRRSNLSAAHAPDRPNIRHGIGMAILMHSTSIPGRDMGSAMIKMNDDGSFNLMVGATDIGTGSDTVLSQIAADVLGTSLQKIIVHSSDTDFTPFDVGAYASSTTFISGNAVRKAAEQVRERIFERAAIMLKTSPKAMIAREDRVYAPDGRFVSMTDIALHSLHIQDQQQIMGSASHWSLASPQVFGAQFAEVEVDIETGQVTIVKLTLAVDCGTVINPVSAIGQMEGGQAQALGYALSEEMIYKEGTLLTRRFGDYHIFQANEMPEIVSILVPTYEESGPYGAKGLGEIPIDGVAPAVANAVYHATGLRIRELPIVPEKVWRALNSLQNFNKQ